MEPAFLLEFGIPAASVIGALAVAKWRVDQTEKDLEKLQEAFQQHRLEMAEKYVSAAAFSKFEAEIKGGLDRLTSRLDQVLAKGRHP